MSAKRKSFTVTRNGKTLTVYPYDERWRFAWRENETTPWRYVTRKTKAKAEEAAWEKLGEIDAGGLIWSALDGDTRRFLEDVHRLATPADFDAVKAFLTSRRRSSEIVASVARFLDHKTAEVGEETRHLGNVRRNLTAMAKTFAGRSVVDITDADLKRWWLDRVSKRDDAGSPVKVDGVLQLLSEKTRNEVRGDLVAFWNWSIVDGIHPKEVTPADKLPRVKNVARTRNILILTPAGFIGLAREIAEEWRPWLVLCGLCGMRPDEVAPAIGRSAMTRRDKRGLRREEIDWRFKVIRVPKVVSKVDTPRNIPLSDAAIAWLAWAGVEEGQTGPVCSRNPAQEEETLRLGRQVFQTGWPQDVLRHSYASYRNAEIHNLPKVAEEMGTSVNMLNKDYHNPRASEEAAAWWAMRPDHVRCRPMEGHSGSILEDLPLVVGL